MGFRYSPVRNGGRSLAVQPSRHRTAVPEHRQGQIRLSAGYVGRSDEPVAEPAQSGHNEAIRKSGEWRPRYQETPVVPVHRLVRVVQMSGDAAVRADGKRHRRHQKLQ